MRNLQVPVRRGSISGCERAEIREFRGSFRAEFAARPFSRIRARTEAEGKRISYVKFADATAVFKRRRRRRRTTSGVAAFCTKNDGG